jgi:hypothetical protein
MSELEKRAGFSRYESLPTEELQEILRKHTYGETQTAPDTDELYYIMEVLAKRREKEEPQAFRSDEEALSDFRKNHMGKEAAGCAKIIRLPKRTFKTVVAMLAIVLVVAMGTTISAEAFHIDILSRIANWTKEIFQFADGSYGKTDPAPEADYSLELKSLQDALAGETITEKIVPTWMPEEYKNIDLKIINTPRVRNISAIYEKNDERLIIKICQTIGAQAPQVEKNDDLLEVYVVDGVEYYIFSNTETLQAVWSIGEFECIIGGKITLEEMKRMIDSI